MKGRWGGFLGLLFLLIFGGIALPLALPPQPEAHSAKNADASQQPENHGNGDPFAALNPIFYWIGGRTDTQITAYATIVIAVFTAILGVGTWRLWLATDRLVEGAKDTSQRQLRAYVAIGDINLKTEDDKPIITAILKNTGQTPAKNLRTSIGVSWDTEPEGDVLIDEDMPASKRDLGAGIEMPAQIIWDSFEGQLMKDIFTGQQLAWLLGVVEYEDIFGEKRFTWFKFNIRGEESKSKPGEFFLHFSGARDGNRST